LRWHGIEEANMKVISDGEDSAGASARRFCYGPPSVKRHGACRVRPRSPVTIIYAVRNSLTAAEISAAARQQAQCAFTPSSSPRRRPRADRAAQRPRETFDWRGRGLDITVLVAGLALAGWGFRRHRRVCLNAGKRHG
jgi:hypothetical protein